MNPLTLEIILSEALLHGSHAQDCAFKQAQKLGNLPARHPRHQKANVDLCDCWKKKALRMRRALSRVSRSITDEPDQNPA